MERLFVDTSAWAAFINAKDPDHRRVRTVLREFAGRLLTSNFVFDEAVTLCRYRLGHAIALKVGQALLDDRLLDLVRVTVADEQEAWSLFADRRDQAYSFTDCTSFVLLRRLGVRQVAALDADFRHEGFDVLPTE